ncbi:uncharacterized protein LOC117648328 [Thrips palmi]|uniref:Uncharacterized protein LOC117648328 n=1 Tax=Thrips palmi TaxID=161013 RepID=A0A6P8Z8B6_THRPL|nr:uncharacterized protein LOC117648328 [Thrips palmi]XP_034246695.1 uncharacterized protein LOC117648328 [Thrips palmi]
MSFDPESKKYKMCYSRRGKAVIFNHDSSKNPRPGSSVDVKKLVNTYESLGFQTKVHKNLKFQNIKSKIKKLSREDFSDADCLCITVLTHGLSRNYVEASDVAYKVHELWTPFTDDKCKSLAGKPKLFIIQACRGDKRDCGTILNNEGGTETDNGESYTIPSHADFLLAYSSVEGTVSFRNKESGSWFIQMLCDELQKNAAKMDFLKLLTTVSRKVALDFETENEYNPSCHKNKQVPSVVSTLIRDIHFTSAGDKSSGNQNQIDAIQDMAGKCELSADGLQDRNSDRLAPNTPGTPILEEKGCTSYNSMAACYPMHSQKSVASVSSNANDMTDMPNPYNPLKDHVGTSHAKMPVGKESKEYNMSQHGIAVVFNNGTNDPLSGSKYDENKLIQTYENLGLKTELHNNVTMADIQSKIENLSKENFDDAACLCVTVLFYDANSETMRALENLWTHFTADRCKTLAGKPKIFIIQARRGKHVDSGVDNVRSTCSETDGRKMYRIPNHADFLLVYSTAKDCVAWRDSEKGSWFIQSLCDELQSNASELDLLKLLTNVSRKVALHHQSSDDQMSRRNEQKQVPCVVSMLIRDVYLRPKT